jgi:hypothetical protein
VQPLEELRMLSNLQIDGKAPLQSFLLGQPQFRDTLAREELDQLRQRIIASYHLGPMNEEETQQYIEHRLRTVGWDNDPRFTADVFPAIHRHTGGVPRRINTLCSRLLLYGFLEEGHELTGAIVDEVAGDLDREIRRVLPVNGEAAASLAAANGNRPPPIRTVPDQDELMRRVGVLETYVRSHDKTIRRVLQLAADFLEGRK